MSRGGRGGRGRGGGGRKAGPDMSWQDDVDVSSETTAPLKRIPGPMFPERHLPTPKPLSAVEKSQVRFLIDARDQIRNGPLYTVLEPSQLLDDKGKVNARAGFDPFNDQERYTNRYHRKRRTIPDHGERGGHTLSLFPVELWSVLDPRKRQKEYWETLDTDVRSRLARGRGIKRKREKLKLSDMGGDDDDDHDDDDDDNIDDDKNNGSAEDSDEDAVIDSGRRRKKVATKTRKRDLLQSRGRQKKGLDAEDDYPDVDQQDDDAEGTAGPGGEDEPQDSEFGSDEDDDAYDDYNAENYFDDGADDDMGDVDDDGGGGGGGGDYY